METKHIIFALLLTLTLPIWYGCSEDDEPLVTDNKVEEIEGFKLSSFASKLIKWRLSEAGENYHIILHSHADNKLYDYDLKVNNNGNDSVLLTAAVSNKGYFRLDISGSTLTVTAVAKHKNGY